MTKFISAFDESDKKLLIFEALKCGAGVGVSASRSAPTGPRSQRSGVTGLINTWK